MSQITAPTTATAAGLAHLRALSTCNSNTIAPYCLALDCQRLRLLAESESHDRLRPKWLIREAALWRPALGRRIAGEFKLIEPFRLFDPPGLVELIHGLQEAGVLPAPKAHIRRTAVVNVRDLHRQNIVLLKALHFDQVVVRTPAQQPLDDAWADLWEQNFERCSLAVSGNEPTALGHLLECLAQYRPDSAQLTDVATFDDYMSAPSLTAILMQLQYFRSGLNTVQRFNSQEIPPPRHQLDLGPGGGGSFGGYDWHNLASQSDYISNLHADVVPAVGTAVAARV